MPTLIDLICAYGLSFGFQQKATILHGRSAITDALIKCTYCLGFHCGWMLWVLSWLMAGMPALTLAAVPTVIAWCFTSSAFCYSVDAAVKWLEVRTPVE